MKYTWFINEIEVYPEIDGFKNLVKKIYYCYLGKENEFSGWVRGFYLCSLPGNNLFTNYEDLKFEQVIEWLENGIDLDKLKEEIKDQIDKQKSPPLVSLPLPWIDLSK